MKIRLTKKQWQFIRSDCDESLFGGAAGGGKSYALLIHALLYALRYPGSRQLMLRRSFPELKRTLIRTSHELFPASWGQYRATDYCWRFKNGSLVEFGYCEHAGDVARYQSAEYDGLAFDELTHFSHYQYACLAARLRGVNPFPKYIKAASNPGGPGHAWVKERFLSPKPWMEPHEIKGQRRIYIPARIYDNTFLMKADPGYIQRLEDLPELERRAFLEGDWDIFAGQFFPEYRLDCHGCTPFAIPASWRRFVSLDWGYNDPCAVLWHAAYDSHIYTYRELYVRQMTGSQVAQEIRRLSQGEEIAYYVASPDMWQRRGADSVYGENIADSFQGAGIHLMKADNARVVGWQRVREYLALASDGRPYWQFFPALCPNLARSLPALVFDAHNPEDAAGGEDHAPESLRYALMSRPRPAKAEAVKSRNLWMFDSGSREEDFIQW